MRLLSKPGAIMHPFEPQFSLQGAFHGKSALSVCSNGAFEETYKSYYLFGGGSWWYEVQSVEISHHPFTTIQYHPPLRTISNTFAHISLQEIIPHQLESLHNSTVLLGCGGVSLSSRFGTPNVSGMHIRSRERRTSPARSHSRAFSPDHQPSE